MNIFGLQISRAPKGKSLSALAQSWLRGDDLDGHSGAGLTLPYDQSAWVYVAVSRLATNLAQIPFRICRMSTSARGEAASIRRKRGARSYRNFRKKVLLDNVIDSGPVVDLFKQPFPSMDRSLFWQSVMTWRCLRGEFFILPLDGANQPVFLPGRTGGIERMVTLSPDWFMHQVQGFDFVGWRYTGAGLSSPIESQVLLPSEVVHSRTPNPHGIYWRGMSPLSVAWVTAAGDYAAEQFMKGLMMNNADTGVIVTTDQQATPEQVEAIKAALRERKRKAGTPDRPLFLWGGAKLEKPMVSSADMQFIENRKLNREEIGAIFNVPSSMMGITERQQSLGGGPGQEQERLAFFESSITPHCRDLEAAVEPIIKTFGADLEGYFDVDDLPILQEARRQRLDAATKAFAMGWPPNQINELYDLGYEAVPWGDKGYLPFNLQEAGSIGAAPEPGDPNAPSTPGSQDQPPGDPNANHFARVGSFLEASLSTPNASRGSAPHVCKGSAEYEAYLRAREKRSVSKVQRFVFEQRGRVLKKLNDVIGKQFVHMKRGDKVWWTFREVGPLNRGVDDLWNAPDELERLMKAMKPLWISDLEDGGKAVFGEIGSDPATYKVPPSEAIAYMGRRRNVMSGVNDTTWNEVRSSLQQGLADGDTMDELAQRVRDKFQGIADGRAYTVALTETTAATNSGRHIAMVEAKVPRKGWGTSGLENTRTTHLANAALSEEKNGIPVEEAWPNGCMFPGDPEGEPGETINCRCYGFAILDK